MPENNNILQMKDVRASYGSVPALRGVSLGIRQGEIVVLIGHHGSGKTAVLKAICGLIPVVGGEVLFAELPIHNLPPEKVVSLGISYVDEMKLLFPAMSVSDNLILGAYHRRGKDGGDGIEADIQVVYQLFPVLEERKKQYAGTLSGGEQQMLAIGRALMSHPKLLLLDCPTLGLAPKLVRKVVGAIAELRDRGVNVLLIDQKLERVINIVDRGYVIEDGRAIFEGSPEELLAVEEGKKPSLLAKEANDGKAQYQSTEARMTEVRTPQTDLKERQNFFTRIYDDMTSGMLSGGWLKAQYLEPVIRSGITSGLVLEVGSGPGYLGLEWLKSTEGTTLKCLDINENMIATAREHASQCGLSHRVEYLKADASRMPFRDEHFDAVFSNCSLHEWAHPEPILSEINRVLRPGGRYCIVDLKRDMKPRVKRFLWAQTQPEEMRPTCLAAIEASYTAGEMRAMLARTGLQNWDIDENFWGLVISGQKPG